MKQGVWMVMCCVSCIFILALVSATPLTISILEKIQSAFINSYNPDDDFEKNVFDILSILCPNSLYCIKDLPDVLKNAEEMYHGTDLVSKSRRVLIEHSEKFMGCCQTCSCKPDCREKSNCCSTSIFNRRSGEKPIMECIPTDLIFHFQGVKELDSAVYMITACNPTYSVSDTRKKCEKPNIDFPDEIIPVHSESLGNIYFNNYCALCNFVNTTEEWDMRFIFKFYIHPHNIPVESHTLYKSLVRSSVTGRANVIFSPRYPDKIRSLLEPCVPFINVIDVCSANTNIASNTSMENFINTACQHPVSLYQSRGVYSNVLCWFCHPSIFDLQFICSPKGGRQPAGLLTGLLDFKSKIKASDDNSPKASSKQCICTEWYDTSQGICRPVLCPFLEHRVDCDCKRLITNVSGLLTDIRLTLRLPMGVEHIFDAGILRASFLRHVISTFAAFLDRFHFKLLANQGTHLCNSETGQSLYFVLMVKKRIGYDIRDETERLYKSFLKIPAMTVRKKKFRVFLGPIYKLNWTGVTNTVQDDGNDTNCTYLKRDGDYVQNILLTRRLEFSKLIYCEKVKILSDELQHLTNISAGFRSVEEHFLPYFYDSERSHMCLEDFIKFVEEVSSANIVLSIDTFKPVWPLFCFTIYSPSCLKRPYPSEV